MEMLVFKRITGHFLFLLLFTITALHCGAAFGFDSANSCSPNKMSRRGRAQLVATIPCDLSRQSYCHLPGAAYPWHAVRRFVHENQGLMKRMYGDVKHISILRNEIQNNDIDIEDLEQTAARYSRDGFRRTKILHNQFENARINEVLKEPHFRPVSSTTTQSSTSTNTTPTTSAGTPATATDATTVPIEPATIASETLHPTTQYPKEITRRITPPPTTEASKRHTSKLDDVELDDEDDDEDDANDQNIESNSVYEPTSSVSITLGDNIKIVESPNLGLGNISTEAVTISTTLKLAPQANRIEPPTTIRSTNKDNLSETISIIANMTKMRVDGISVTTPLKATPNNNASVSTSTVQSLYNSAPTEPTTKATQAKRQPSTTAATKPVLRDGQLFQDTVQKEPVQVGNLRGVNACPVKEEVVAPFWANNTRGEVLALLNLYPFEQYVHWEKCTHEHRQMYCRDGCRCEQQYRLHRLLAYDPHNECRGIFSDWFRFPSCCICKCYDISADFRATSRSPRSEADYRHPVEVAEAEVRRAVYEHASEDWYRPREELDLYD